VFGTYVVECISQIGAGFNVGGSCGIDQKLATSRNEMGRLIEAQSAKQRIVAMRFNHRDRHTWTRSALRDGSSGVC